MRAFIKRNFRAALAAAAFTLAILLAALAFVATPPPSQPPLPAQAEEVQPSVWEPFLPQNCSPFFAPTTASYVYAVRFSAGGTDITGQVSHELISSNDSYTMRDVLTTPFGKSAIVWELAPDLSCRRVRASAEMSGMQRVDRELPCVPPIPFFGAPCREEMVLKGLTNASTPFGTIPAKVYHATSSNATYIVANNIDVPLKFAIGNMQGELIRYEE
ncbi:MAG: hypothetical protein QXG98_01835 [Candidatus Micrarchaeia archaeon]